MKHDSINFKFDDSDQLSVWYYGDYLKKTALLMKDSDTKWKVACKADELQNTEFPTPEIHAKLLLNLTKDLTSYLEERPNDDHFIL